MKLFLLLLPAQRTKLSSTLKHPQIILITGSIIFTNFIIRPFAGYKEGFNNNLIDSYCAVDKWTVVVNIKKIIMYIITATNLNVIIVN